MQVAAQPVKLGAESPAGSATGDILALVDFCKGVAILGVMLVHAVHRGFGWQGVHVFIVLSGFTLACSDLKRGGTVDRRTWALRRAHRILPSYWLMAVVGFALTVLFSLVPSHAARTDLPEAGMRLALDLTLLRNFSYTAMFADPNAALWFGPLIVGLYLCYPRLFDRARAAGGQSGAIGVLMVALGIELASRAAAIYFLDGSPVGYGQGFLPFGPKPPSVSHTLPVAFPFQLWAPFGLFITRIAEFTLGIAAAVALDRRASKSGNPLLGSRWAALGLLVWLMGNAMVYAGRWAWIGADFVIAVGACILVLNVAEIVRLRLPGLFRIVSSLGVWSYYLFLTHLAVGYVCAQILTRNHSAPAVLFTVAAGGAGLILAPRWVRRFDNSPAAAWIVRQTVGRLVGSGIVARTRAT